MRKEKVKLVADLSEAALEDIFEEKFKYLKPKYVLYHENDSFTAGVISERFSKYNLIWISVPGEVFKEDAFVVLTEHGTAIYSTGA